MAVDGRLEISRTDLAGVLVLTPRRFRDDRGWFAESWNQTRLLDSGVDIQFVQDNLSHSAAAGTVRGLHFQLPPFAQDKLVSVLTGCVLDVAVDLRRDSPTFGRHVAAELSAKSGRQLLVPKGFAHGFVTQDPDTTVFYKVSAAYSPNHDRGLAFDDPDLGIDWGISREAAIMSEKDRALPVLRDLRGSS